MEICWFYSAGSYWYQLLVRRLEEPRLSARFKYFRNRTLDIILTCSHYGYMPYRNCELCSTEFYVKPSHLKLGWGKYCSNNCYHEAARTGDLFKCNVCKKETYKSKKEQRRSKSGKYFCSKSCQTAWRNSNYSGSGHSNWKNGKGSYRVSLLRSQRKQICEKCKTDDTRILAVHHKDKNRDNNVLSNLIWLCHNCHYLVHHDRKEAEGFVVPVA